MGGSHHIRRGKADNLLDVRYTYTVLIQRHAVPDGCEQDEVTLESHDSEYKQTLVVGKDGDVFEDEWIRITFTGMKPRKSYRCVHRLKRPESQVDAKVLLFEHMLLDTRHFNQSAVSDIPRGEEEQGAFSTALEELRADSDPATTTVALDDELEEEETGEEKGEGTGEDEEPEDDEGEPEHNDEDQIDGDDWFDDEEGEDEESGDRHELDSSFDGGPIVDRE